MAIASYVLILVMKLFQKLYIGHLEKLPVDMRPFKLVPPTKSPHQDHNHKQAGCDHRGVIHRAHLDRQLRRLARIAQGEAGSRRNRALKREGT